MKKAERIGALHWLGSNIENLQGLDAAIEKAGIANPFFTDEFCRISLQGISEWMKKDLLEDWLSEYPDSNTSQRVGLIMAGNLPLVGWHDVMSIFAHGHICRYKTSSQDEILPTFLINVLTTEYPAAASYFEKTEQMKGIDAIIATGSNASAAQFDYYFRNIPRLIRGAKSSLGLIYGFENREELSTLCDDIMQYFGMGCRSITKLLVPADYDFREFFEALEKYRYLTNHYRFQNNAIYHKAIFLMNGDPFLENDILILRENEALFSPPGVLNFQRYRDMEEARQIIENDKQKMQCMVSHQGQFPGSIPFGTAQKPGLKDYADGIDTTEFLQKLLP